MSARSFVGGLAAFSVAVLIVAGPPTAAQTPEPSPTPSGCVWDPNCGSLLPPEPTPAPTESPAPNSTPTPAPEHTAQPGQTEAPAPEETDAPKPTREPRTEDEDEGEHAVADPTSSPAVDGFVAGSEDDMPSGFATGDPPFKALPGPRSTTEVLKLLEEKGIVAEKAARVLAPFPVFGAAVYSNDWNAPRYTPSFHLHEGTDIFAARGTPVLSSADGEVSRVTLGSSVGGTSVWVTDGEGTGYYYAHLNEIAAGIAVGTKVRTGDLVGYVGSTGNAAGGRPHLHFEIHPDMGEAVAPVPYLDNWLYDALQEAKGLPGGRSPTRLGQPELVAGWLPAPIDVPASMDPALSVMPVADRPDEPSSSGTWPTILTLLAGPALVLRPRRRAEPVRLRRELS